ncbi:alkaline phosphatase, partial [Nitratireductor sp. GCM10026969]|uniref:alkaline phosphatase n=1 Tax=Nitratireductor sp. GCM10026969 TaxID=3252645 RepID=UPI0036067AF2
MLLLMSPAPAQDVVQAGSAWYAAGEAALAAKMAEQPNTGRARNVILFIADGMGVGTNYAIRLFEGQQKGKLGEEHILHHEGFPYTALVKTYNINAQTPDSAATAGAINSGVKQVFGTINAGEDAIRGDCASQAGEKLTLFSELAASAGKSVGVVSTARITHATGAAVYARVAERNWEAAAPEGCTDIATQLVDMIDAGVIDLALGGGARNFVPAGAETP